MDSSFDDPSLDPFEFELESVDFDTVSLTFGLDGRVFDSFSFPEATTGDTTASGET